MKPRPSRAELPVASTVLTKVLPLVIVGGVLAAAPPLLAQGPSGSLLRSAPTPPPGTPAPAEEEDERRPHVDRVLFGEITELDRKDGRFEGRFEVRPWDVSKPRRLAVTLSPGARFYEQVRGKMADLKVGDRVMVIPDEGTRRLKEDADEKDEPEEKPVGKGGAKPSGEPLTAPVTSEKGGKRYAAAMGVLRLVSPEEGEAPAKDAEKTGEKEAGKERAAEPDEETPRGQKLEAREEAQTAHALLAAAVPLFREPDRKQRVLREPLHHNGVAIGVVTDLEPLAVRTSEKTRRFTLYGKPVVVNHRAIRPEELRTGQTVMLRSDAGPQPGRKVEAQVVAVCGKPKLSSSETRRFWMREQGVKNR